MSETPERRLDVFINDELVGALYDERDVWGFHYARDWAESDNAFDLSPALASATLEHVDGASRRPVQWYFDNLLPEEQLRVVLAKEAKVDADDAFGLLAYFGAESAGSLVLLPTGPRPALERGLRPLPDEALSRRIRNLPRASLAHDAPKRMSLAGAQHKLAVVMDEQGRLFEPLPGEVSTHILKPDHQGSDYPSTVVNEYFVMRLAKRLGLSVPAVERRYVPEPVYIIERFDRYRDGGAVQRLHVIDTCQLLNKSRSFKYSAATLDALVEAIGHCRTRAAARMRLFQWLVFNALVGNADNHLKNLSFLVSPNGIGIAPFYDLLCTAVYGTPAFAQQVQWPAVELALPLPSARTFALITRASFLAAGEALGLAANTAKRELDRLVGSVVPEAEALFAEIERENQVVDDAARSRTAGELRLLRAVLHIVITETSAKLGRAERPR